MPNENENHSTCKQVLLDMLVACPQYTDKIQDLLHTMSDDDFNNADRQFNKHQYPINKITYSKTSNVEACPEWITLTQISRDACLVLDALIKINKSPHNLVAIPVESKDNYDLKIMTNLDKRNIRKAIAILLQYDVLRIYEKPKKNQPTVYMINPKFATVGKSDIEIWNQLERGSAELDKLDCHIQLIPTTKTDVYYDNDGNEKIYTRDLKVSKVIAPCGTHSIMNLIIDLINSMTDKSKK